MVTRKKLANKFKSPTRKLTNTSEKAAIAVRQYINACKKKIIPIRLKHERFEVLRDHLKRVIEDGSEREKIELQIELNVLETDARKINRGVLTREELEALSPKERRAREERLEKERYRKMSIHKRGA